MLLALTFEVWKSRTSLVSIIAWCCRANLLLCHDDPNNTTFFHSKAIVVNPRSQWDCWILIARTNENSWILDRTGSKAKFLSSCCGETAASSWIFASYFNLKNRNFFIDIEAVRMTLLWPLLQSFWLENTLNFLGVSTKQQVNNVLQDLILSHKHQI